MPSLRKGYRGKVIGRGQFNPKITRTQGERVSDFTEICHNESGSSYGYRYSHSSATGIQTQYVVVGIGEDGDFFFKHYSNEEDFYADTSSW